MSDFTITVAPPNTFTVDVVAGPIVSGGGSSNLDNLTDVVIATAALGQLLRFDGTNWVNWTHDFVSTSGSFANPSWITSLAWAKLTGVPSTFPPSAHVHSWADITSGVPSTFPPSAHVHSWADITTGRPTTLAGYGITDAQPLDGDLTAIAALAGATGLARKTALNTWTLDTATYLTANQTITLSGDATGSGTTAITVTLPNVATAGTFRSVTVNAKGLVTAGTNPTTVAGYGITDTLVTSGDQALTLTQLRQARKNLIQGSAPTVGYSGGRPTTFTYSDGSVKTLTYTGNRVTRSDHVYTSPARTYRKDFTYNGDGTLNTVTESIL